MGKKRIKMVHPAFANPLWSRTAKVVDEAPNNEEDHQEDSC